MLITFTTACATEQNGITTKQVNDTVSIPVIKNENGRFVSLRKLAGIMGYQMAYDDTGTWMNLGGNDVQYSISAKQPIGKIGDQERLLTQTPIETRDDLLIPDSTVSEMFQEELKYFITGDKMMLYAFPELTPDGADYQFKDAASTRLPDDQSVFNPLPSPIVNSENKLTRIAIDKVITQAQTFIGVPYLFGAKSFETTKRFDCSSFTQYIYSKQGLKLPRSSRDQALQGIAVSRQMLKPGDLMFFYVPGRFRSNSIIGHVGLYIGNGQMIHATPSAPSGVKITSINSSYWQQKFLKARRVATAI
jgi:cell wall-associated NlpC family hydrolase